jgi:hypothetical protein
VARTVTVPAIVSSTATHTITSNVAAKAGFASNGA